MFKISHLRSKRVYTVKKISKTKIAATYAQALYEAAAEKNAEDKVLADVLKLGEIIREDRSFIDYMANPMRDDAAKKEALAEISAKLKWDVGTLRCMDIIAENQRFAELSQIIDKFVAIYYAKRDIEQVEVEAVKKLSAAQDEKLRLNLENVLGKKVVVTYKTAPELLGGLRIRYGSEMIDNSLLNKLKRLEIIMKGEE